MIRLSTLTILLTFITSFARAQYYKTAVGVKCGYPGYGTLNVKHFMDDFSAVECNLGVGLKNRWLQVLYEQHTYLKEGFDLYWGLGGQVGFFDEGYTFKHNEYDTDGTYAAADAVLGIEYTFNRIPLDIALDVGPTLHPFSKLGFGFGGALAARFAIR